MKVGITREDIANGKPKSWSHCPLALALKRETGIDYLVEYDRVYGPSEEGLYQMDDGLTVPAKARRFIAAFDAGKPVRPCTLDLPIEKALENVAGVD